MLILGLQIGIRALRSARALSVHLGNVLGNLVGAPADAGGIGRIGHGVLRSCVVEGAMQGGPDVLLEIGDVVEIDWLQQFAGDGLGDSVGRMLVTSGRTAWL